jgi:hypothetical protein
MNKLFFIFLIAIILFSCTEDFTIKTEDADARIVLEGAITNEEGPYFFKLSLSNPSNINTSSNTGITDALFIISDNKGTRDTLKAFRPKVEINSRGGSKIWTFKRYLGEIDTIPYYGDITNFLEGIYCTTKVKGVPGNTYTLYVKYKDNVVTATDSMPNVPVIDSVKFLSGPLSKEGERSLAPYIYFKEPRNEKNYYMMNFGNDNILDPYNYSSSRVWSFSIFDDKNMSGYVNGLNIDDGANPVNDGNYYYYPSTGSLETIRLLSLSPKAYEFFKSLISQFDNDGGAYTPSPTSPPTNLSGNALGFFRASAVSERKVLVKE